MNDSDMQWLPLEQGAIEEALSAWLKEAPGMGLLALLPEMEKDRLPILQALCRQKGVPLAGAIFPALVSGTGFQTDGAWLMRLGKMPPYFLLADINAGDVHASEKIAAQAQASLGPLLPTEGRSTLYMIFDGLVPNIGSILDGLYQRLADRVSYAGVNAGSESFQPMPCLFDAERVVAGGVLGFLLAHGSTTVLCHGFTTPEHSMVATSTDGNRILSMDWRPAFEVYQDVIKAEYGIELTRENFYQYGVHFPFGILRANGEVLVRIPVALMEDGSLHCVGEVPENTMLMLLKAPGAEPGGCVAELAARLVQANGSQAGRDLLTFYCAGRRMHLGELADQELAELAALSGARRIAGALSLGEIGSTRAGAYPMFHNATLVCTPWQGG